LVDIAEVDVAELVWPIDSAWAKPIPTTKWGPTS
jgi:hypothetical protein